MIQVNFIKLRSGASQPVYATDGSAAADLFACLDDVAELDGLAVSDGSVTIPAGGRASVPIGIAIEPVVDLRACDDLRPPEDIPPHHRHTLPDNYVGLVFGRSGHGAKFGVTLANSVGVIDSDYRGEIRVTLINHGEKPFTVAHGDRIAQLAFVPVATARFIEARELGDTTRGTGGFGSTGR